jgi:SAM-dependent methyltransferase
MTCRSIFVTASTLVDSSASFVRLADAGDPVGHVGVVSVVESERFQPKGLRHESGLLGKVRFGARLAVDLQTYSVFRLLRDRLPERTGTLLDIGCGDSPYRFLASNVDNYIGVDVPRSTDFGYGVNVAARFDGSRLPLADQSVRTVLCTEVLEHVSDPRALIDEIFRVLEPGGVVLATIPWSARFHFKPWDYVRYTPTKLSELFSQFDISVLEPRGTDWSAVGSKLMVMWSRSILGSENDTTQIRWRNRLVASVATPVAGIGLLAGHAGVRWKSGSSDDPLGYFLECRKPLRVQIAEQVVDVPPNFREGSS